MRATNGRFRVWFVQVVLTFLNKLLFFIPNRMTRKREEAFFSDLLHLMWGGRWFGFPLTGTDEEQDLFLKRKGIHILDERIAVRGRLALIRQTVSETNRGEKWLWRSHGLERIPELLELVKYMYKM